jgi:mannonate dehydratase
MKLTHLFFGNKSDIKWQLVKQMGINEVVVKLAPELTGMPSIDNLSSFQESMEIYEKNGFKIIGLEGDQFNMMPVKLGLKGKEEVIEKYQKMLENMGTLGIPLLCYNFMLTGWYRTQTDIIERGGALVSGFRFSDPKNEVFTKYGQISESQIWENYQYFIDQVMPVAEANGVKMALHPDDPPVGPINGIARVFTSAQNMRKVLSFSDSPAHGLTFCQGSYATMNENIIELIAEFGKAKKIFFIHIRDVEGTPENFRETFHDNGPTDMYAAMKAYQKADLLDVPLRSDHVPTMAGESNDNFGYEMNGNLFGVGYIKGLIEASKSEIINK